MIIEETERLIIKEIEMNEAKEASELLSLFKCSWDESGKQTTEYTEDMVKAYIDTAYGFYGYGYFGLYDKSGGEFIGIAGFREGSYPLEIGYAIKTDLRGKGYATEAVRALVKYAEEYFMWVVEDQEEDERKGEAARVIPLSSENEKVFCIKKREKVLVYGRTDAYNVASQRILLKNGFTEL